LNQLTIHRSSVNLVLQPDEPDDPINFETHQLLLHMYIHFWC